MRGWARIGVLISMLRRMLDEVLARKIDEPEMDLGDNDVVAIVARLVELDGMDQ
jgi:ATP-dependent RNA helicase DHX57